MAAARPRPRPAAPPPATASTAPPPRRVQHDDDQCLRPDRPTTLDRPNADTPFCQFEAEVEEQTGAAEDDAAFLAALAALEPRMDQWVADAPNNEQRAAATTLHQATQSAIGTNSDDPFDGDDVTEATLTVQLFCGATRLTPSGTGRAGGDVE